MQGQTKEKSNGNRIVILPSDYSNQITDPFIDCFFKYYKASTKGLTSP